MASKPERAAFYLRVSTDGQTTENQRHALTEIAERRGWKVVAEYEDAGISGAKGRDKRPGFDKMLKDAVRRRFDVLMVWAVDRLGRSSATALTALDDLHSAGVDVFVERQALDTTSPYGKAMFGIAAVFAELERGLIRDRIIAGLAHVKKHGPRPNKKPIGRPSVSADKEAAIRERLALGHGILRVAREVGVGSSVVQRVKAAASETRQNADAPEAALRNQRSESE
ncbi:recombinase family protein [Roseococcus pinisoli]|uniref:Recombinase family protein n=1 Tax=Roseococcus pinisoli TaxID=2835040 RepID=A0ABS5QFB5_9PROT|nr:recombinase family protein [Roseococcus pinisoli]MBS7811233.1 recombinase family protein [Roseococcus pinisoli]